MFYMKIRELHKVSEKKIGRINKNGLNPEPHEESTAVHLAQFGFDIEFIKPRNTYKTNSADIFMQGAVWEMKAPITNKESTIKEDFRKAKSQADRVIFDLRRVKKHPEDVKKYLIKMFEKPGRICKLMIIEKNSDVILYFYK